VKQEYSAQAWYQELTSRNWGFIGEEEQRKIQQTSIVLAGCGLGSQIATLAARVGFERFVLYDRDVVEVNNLNRQAFSLDDVGMYKVDATENVIQKINPHAVIETFPEAINVESVEKVVSAGDIIVNMVDPDETMYLMNKLTTARKAPILFPLNLGFGGFSLVFTSSSASLEEILGEKVFGSSFYPALLQSLDYLPPKYLQLFYRKHDQELEQRPLPQLGIAAALTSALIVTTMIRIATGRPIKEAPEVITCDALIEVS
jgi:molybdopterin/thiamine biosynthesis adenylyltransferase